jgi:prepilin-type N-terminal cleavage/methylation domain-containing protein
MMKRRGFTLVELLVTVVIMAILAIATLFTLKGRNNTDLSSAGQQIGTILREAQSRSMTQASDTTWGVYFGNPTGGHPFFALFSGPAYSTSTRSGYYSLPTDVCYETTNIPVGSSTQVTFSPLGGAPSSPITVLLDLTTPGCSSGGQYTVSVGAQGTVSD